MCGFVSRENHYLFRFVNTSDDDIQAFLNTLHDRNRQVIVGYSDYPPTLNDMSTLNGILLEPTDNFTASDINDIFKDVVSDGELIYAEVVGGSIPDNSEFVSVSTNQSVNSEVVDNSTVGNQQVSNENNEHVSNKSDDVIDELLPSVETLRNALTPELNVDYDLSKLSAQDRMSHMMFENNLSTMYNVNRDYIRDVKDDDSLDGVIEDLRKELSNSHLQGISDYQQSLDKLKNFEQKLNDEKSQIKQRYEDEMNRYIQDEVEKLKQQYRESHPDTTDEEIEALVKQSEPEIQRLKQAISFNRSNAKEDVFDKLLEINPDNQSLTKALDYLQEKKRIESQLSQMYELLEQERENIKFEQENVQPQREVKAEPEISERERELEAQLRQQQQLNEQRERELERERESVDSNLIAQEVIKQIESSGILSQLGSSTAKAEEIIEDIPVPNDEELDNVTNQTDKLIEQSGVKGYTSEDIEPEKSFEEVTEPEDTDEEFNEMFGELGFDDDFDNDFDDEEPVEEEPVEEEPAEEEPAEEEPVEPTEQENRNTENIGVANVDELNDEFNSDDEDDIIDSFNEHVDDEQELDLSYNDGDEMSDIAEEQAIQDSLVDDDYSYQDDDSDLDDLDDVDDEDNLSHLSKRERKKLEKEKRKQEKRAEKARKKREKRENKEVKRKPEKDTYGNTEENTPTFFKKMMLIGITLFVLLALAGTVFGAYKFALSPETADEPPTEETADTNNTEQAENEESGETEVAEDGEANEEPKEKEKVKPIPKKGEIYRLAVSDKDYTVTEVHDDGSAVLQAQGEEPITVPHEEFVKLKEKEEAEKEK